jgi:CRP/FNR family transcriptional regulator
METNQRQYNEIPDEFNFDSEAMHYDELKFCRSEGIFKEGTFPGGVYFIKKGKVKIFKTSPDGKEKIIRLMKAGDFIGHKDLISGTRYTYSASAFENTVIYFITKDDFFNLMKKSEISTFFMRLLTTELSTTENELINLAYKPVKGRLVDTLLNLNPGNSSSSSISISREELAGFVGSATETVIRLLSEFRKQNLISVKGRMISVVDSYGLAKIQNIYNYN